MTWSTALDTIELTEDERRKLRTLLRLAVSKFRPARNAADAASDGMAGIADAMRRQALHGELVSANGYLWKGRPPWFDPDSVAALAAEAEQVRQHAVRATHHLMVESAPVARAILESPSFSAFVNQSVGAAIRFVPSSTYYHWYESERDFAEPHLDIEEFAVSMLMLLRHRPPPGGGSRSAFFVCPPGRGALEIPLEVGEAVLLYSGSVVHARSAPAHGEQVTTVSWGFRAG